MRVSPRARRCLETIDKIESILEFYMPEGPELKELKTKEIKDLREYIAEMSRSRKISEIKIAQKIKKDLE